MQTDCYSYGLLNELNSITRKESSQSINFSYDTDGNMRSDGRGIYCYDEYQQMTEARIADGNKLVCRYDAEGLRYEMEENENLIQFIYSGRDVVYEESESASSVRTIRGNGRLIASDVEHARTYYHYASDDLGSITHLICMNEESVKESTNVDSGRIVGCYDYDAFGNRIYETEEVSNRYGFTGELYDRISGQYYLRARYYRPEIGRFTQPDSYHGDGLNLYAYVGNNPVKYVDPSGHRKCGKDNGVESGNKGTGVVNKTTRRQEFRQAKEAVGIPKSAQHKKHKFVFDGSTEDRIVYEFTVDGKPRYIVEHPFDKKGRGNHFHFVNIDSENNPFDKGRYSQGEGHFPEDFSGFAKNRRW